MSRTIPTNIEQIALETWREIHGFDAVFMRDAQVEFLRRCLSKMAAQQDVEPVVIEHPDYHYEAMGCGLEDRNITDRYEAMEHGWNCAIDRMLEQIPDEPLYTEAQLIAAQQRTAEACAKFLDDIKHPGCDLLAVEIRNGKWREYL